MQAARNVGPSPSAAVVAPDGASARSVDDAIEVRDPHDQLIFRYRAGRAELSVPVGDLTLSAPNGRVSIQSAEDVRIEAARDLRCTAGRTLEARSDGAALSIGPDTIRAASPRFDIEAGQARYQGEVVDVIAKVIRTRAGEVATEAARYEVKARHIVESARTAFRDVEDLLQQRIGRARSIVRDVWILKSRRSVMVSKEDTSIDGERILLG